ncbi:class I SAM-dependent methyltransferase [Marinobacter sp. SS21]|uniref:class I SAM-dependent methyltransferase n=1 Tax=Marinobacter sp. SS21 TaxID=2979460 RepID=UPI00232DE78F|nr:class I SAM-dependent methyltransferase [Marinobacter sp. SS21]MDC0661790.1 class I SAM-dependent methyltransferase [Marinobacter sp. SS21]
MSIECKLCGSEVIENVRFSNFLALTNSNVAVYTCSSCRASFLIGDLDQEIYGKNYFGRVGQEYEYAGQSIDNALHYENIIKNLLNYASSTNALLDLGCGLGHFLEKAEASFNKVVGVDAYLEKKDLVTANAVFLKKALEVSSFNEGEFDVVTMNHSLEHVDDPSKVLGNVNYYLKPNGIVYIEVPFQYWSFYDKVSSVFKPKLKADIFSYHHKSFFTPNSLKAFLANNGFEVLRVETFLPLRGRSRFLGLKGKLLYLFLAFSGLFKKGDFIAIIARKIDNR